MVARSGVAIAPVVAVEETTLLMTMQRVVGRVEVQHDLFGRLLVRLDKHIDHAYPRGEISGLALPMPHKWFERNEDIGFFHVSCSCMSWYPMHHSTRVA